MMTAKKQKRKRTDDLAGYPAAGQALRVAEKVPNKNGEQGE